MVIPKTIRILGHDYTLTLVSRDYMMYDAGKCNYLTCQMVVSVDMPASQQKSTLLHEIIEALNKHMEIGLEHPQISALESGLFQVLVDNHDLRFTDDDAK